ncbi:MAG: hypothetical protein M1115_10835 [Actinobacteria bacterium]|nr:hypothetical protein [Actinomycetota bacterium]
MLFVEGFRLLLVLIGAVVGLQAGKAIPAHPLAPFIGTTLGALLAYVLGGIIGRLIDRQMKQVTRRFRDIPPAEVFAGSVVGATGLLLGLAAGMPLIAFSHSVVVFLIVALVSWVLTGFGIRIGVTKGQQVAAAVGLSRRLAPASSLVPAGTLLLDTSAVMDRSIVVLGQTGLLPGVVVVPQFVLDEVAMLAEGPDPVTARRAQRGMEALDGLRERGIEVSVASEEIPEADHTEEKIAVLADRLGVRLATCSAGLASRVIAEGGAAVDLRRLAADLSPDHLPGERLRVDLVRLGRQPRQAVGYLPDGDMVVVNDASQLVGQNGVDVVVSSTRPTSQGVLVFAHLAYDDPAELDEDGATGGLCQKG